MKEESKEITRLDIIFAYIGLPFLIIYWVGILILYTQLKMNSLRAEMNEVFKN